jgi:hypothetical protein
MGGMGSGRPPAKITRKRTSDYPALDIVRWRRSGLLQPGSEFGGASPAGGLGRELQAKMYGDYVSITRQIKLDSTASKVIWIQLERTACHLGGRRRWFLCPSSDCGRRTTKLYLAERILCRRCLDLAYPRQFLSPSERNLLTCRSIRDVLGGTMDLSTRLPDRPKNMRWSRYRSLSERYTENKRQYFELLHTYAGRLEKSMLG